jgi:hypothetical protein
MGICGDWEQRRRDGRGLGISAETVALIENQLKDDKKTDPNRDIKHVGCAQNGKCLLRRLDHLPAVRKRREKKPAIGLRP